MIIQENGVKRLVIYFIYDKQGIVDEYILYMLRALRENSSEIAVVVNGLLTQESKAALEQITSHILVRENQGLDVWAYKTVIDSYGWDHLVQYDEVVMMNMTIMGPIYPLEEMFTAMSARDLDFWGITMHHEYRHGDPFHTISLGYIPDHLQSHFLAIRRSMVESEAFRKYWNEMPPIAGYQDSVGKHEAVFTKHFADLGFRWDVYADMGADFDYNPVITGIYELITEKRCPIFKRRSFMQEYANLLHSTAGQEAMEAYRYIDEHTDYDVNLIWDNILRLENQADIKKNLHLNYILDEKRGCDISDILNRRKIAVILHIYYDDLADYCLHYLKSLPREADIFVTTDTKEKKLYFEKTFSVLPNQLQVLVMENRGRDVGPRMVCLQDYCMDYDYVCFLHDKKVIQQETRTSGIGFSYRCFENLLGSSALVENILRTLEDEPRVGMLTPPPPNHGEYYLTLGMEWTVNYENTKKLAEELGITVPITAEKEPIASLGGMFWFRPKAMKPIFSRRWDIRDFPEGPLKADGEILHAWERIFNYAVQQEGYYPAWLLSQKCAAIEVTNLNYMLREMNRPLFTKGVGAGYHEDVVKATEQLLDDHAMWRGLIGLQSGSRLYLMGENGYSEETSVFSEALEENLTYSGIRSFSFVGLERFGNVSMLRWDPCENGSLVIRSVEMTTVYADGSREIKQLQDLQSNGRYFNEELLFLCADPQIYFAPDTAKTIQRVDVVCDMTLGIGQETIDQIFAEPEYGVRDSLAHLKKAIHRKLRGKI